MSVSVSAVLNAFTETYLKEAETEVLKLKWAEHKLKAK